MQKTFSTLKFKKSFIEITNLNIWLKKRIGVVVSNKPEKTIVVAIQTRYRHPKYGKLIKTKRYMAHDEEQL